MTVKCPRCGRFSHYFIEAPVRFQGDDKPKLAGHDRVHWCERCIHDEARSPEHVHQWIGEGEWEMCLQDGISRSYVEEPQDVQP